MKTTLSLCTAVLAAALLPTIAFAAKDAKRERKRPAPDSASRGVGEALKPYDKNGDHKLDSEELAALQKTFAELRKLDKNSNGEIEATEVEPPKPAVASGDRKGRAMEGLKKIDKNANGKIDPEEAEALQKMMAGGQIMKRLDQNGNGKLDANELERLNQHLSQGAAGRSPGSRPAAKPAPSASTVTNSKPEAVKTEESKTTTGEVKKEESKKDEAKKDEGKKEELKKDTFGDPTKDPFLPKPESKA